ncbi:hypothetical protein VP01_4295g2 [Puccinia sorghi]|uniref:Integrase catalytic domain-containing protein n=1 Tax=Puccinia sorghi TaxID=27349 RepID=A0A0L6UQ62_9BASI|nr:hypothetical protein VP01_4295g2 [Puccinia sorghi]
MEFGMVAQDSARPYPSRPNQTTEFVNASLEDYCQKNVTRKCYYNAYTLQQNGLAERFNRTILELLCTILYDSGLRQSLWNEVLSACMLTLNQIPTHKSNKSPYEMFKGQAIPLNFFQPIGNLVVVYSHQKKAKLDPRGELGCLIGFDAKLKCYKILLNDGKLLDTKKVDFLNFDSSSTPTVKHNELFLEEPPKKTSWKETKIPAEEDEEPTSFETADEESEDDSLEVANTLVPTASNPDPKSFRGAVSGKNSEGWLKAIEAELNTIENHEVWVDHSSN